MPSPNGLSPRGRGKPHRDDLLGWGLRSIPAWAGETLTAGFCANSPEVYPRVGGGNGCALPATWAIGGLSPRGRGKLAITIASHLLVRSIPAWAGETAERNVGSNEKRVYPRVGGGNAGLVRLPGQLLGLSPRGRGKPGARGSGVAAGWSIPAWAGETTPPPRRTPAIPVYPRVGGGNGD